MFDQLPDDIVLEIVSHLRTARDVARLASSCKHLYHLLSEDGWRTFVRTCFPLLPLPVGKHPKWNELANTLTRQTRAWDTKAFQPIAYTDSRRRDGNFFTGYSNAARPFHPVIDARLTFDKSWEVVSWGAGEDVVGRFRPLNSRGDADAWFRMEGKAKGYSPGVGDVTAIQLAEPNGKLGLLVGRANGDLSLVSAAPGSAGKTLLDFKIPKPTGSLEATTWTSIGSIDILPNQASVIAGNRATVSLFPLDPDGTGEAAPLDSQTFDMPGCGRTQFVHAAKAMNNDTIICALAGDTDPLRYLTITPTGFTSNLVSKNSSLLASRGIDPDKKLTVRAIQPVSPGPSGHTNLLLSAWDDGTCRLLDVRTPSPYDALYRDMYQPFEPISSLITYGSDRFVAGSAEIEALKIFDFRWSKSYYHSAALPCWSGTPFPDPLRGTSSRPLSLMGVGCDSFRGRSCVWHEHSRRDYYRPNYRFHVMPFKGAPRASNSRIFSLAKASDVSDSFYVGLAGAVAEFTTAISDGGEDGVPPAVASAAEKRGWRAQESQFSFAETGDGLLHPGVSMSTFMPRLVQRFGDEIDAPQYSSWYTRQTPKTAAWHRWDKSFWRPTHFTF
ncbi:F-box domain protein [Colletotrichum truncatum]|uniref:F-box domain protein n=1 Tax=Colletotrichum truncatum TaxID=5467 RepID=A0ACC3YT20_COLTU|nr:F-box domain protein [Colletotrichum truncatum]KAF6798999.1 F-box domain protein [Colletotrichum truncatum]